MHIIKLIFAAFSAKSLYCPREIAEIIAEHWINASLPNWRQEHWKSGWDRVMVDAEFYTRCLNIDLDMWKYSSAKIIKSPGGIWVMPAVLYDEDDECSDQWLSSFVFIKTGKKYIDTTPQVAYNNWNILLKFYCEAYEWDRKVEISSCAKN